MNFEGKSQAEINDDVHLALFGDPDTGQKGMVAMTKEMYEAWSAILWLGKIITWIAIILAGIGASWTLIVAAIKHWFSGK
jgi:hypothetical protein